MRRISGIAGAFVVALALAPIGAEAQQIFACVNNGSGAVRIVAQGATCRNDESPLTWNIVGPQGPQGLQGPKGDTGPQGPAGTVLAMQCSVVGTSTNSSFTLLLFSNCSGGVASILTDGGVAARSSGTFLMQPGTYHVEFYAPTGADCSAVVALIDGPPAVATWISSSNQNCLSQQPLLSGLIAGAAIMQFGMNQLLALAVFNSGINFNATLIITKLQ